MMPMDSGFKARLGFRELTFTTPATAACALAVHCLPPEGAASLSVSEAGSSSSELLLLSAYCETATLSIVTVAL